MRGDRGTAVDHAAGTVKHAAEDAGADPELDRPVKHVDMDVADRQSHARFQHLDGHEFFVQRHDASLPRHPIRTSD